MKVRELDEIDPIYGIEMISKTILSSFSDTNLRPVVERQLKNYALVISRATEDGAPFGTIVQAVSNASSSLNK